MSLGFDRVYCMDCLEGMRQLPDNSVDLCVTDPPYFIEALREDLSDVSLRKSSKNNIFFDVFDHFESKKAYIKFIKVFLLELRRVLKPKAQVYMFFSYHHTDWCCLFLKKEFRFYKPLIWYKPDVMGVFPNQYGCNYESILWFRKRAHPVRDAAFVSKINIGNSQRDVFTFYSTIGSYRKECGYHPTPKPVGLVRQLIRNGSDEGDLVIDPFMGSGTTAVAAKQIGRRFIGFENRQEYVDICNKRLAQKILGETLMEVLKDGETIDEGQDSGLSESEGDGAA